MVFVETSFPRGGIAKPRQDETSAGTKNESKMVNTADSQTKHFTFPILNQLLFSFFCFRFADIRGRNAAKK